MTVVYRTVPTPALPMPVRPVSGPAVIASYVGFALFGVFTSVSPVRRELNRRPARGGDLDYRRPR
ncbi:hypothetical protein ABZ078_18205 [Streptomyces sp. NPDC006385]|uniref:hypothetical protein n=1 Tax=Streptomyces sp. NPDC006385 TaxID=3156761 RepID=UPI0033ADE666